MFHPEDLVGKKVPVTDDILKRLVRCGEHTLIMWCKHKETGRKAEKPEGSNPGFGPWLKGYQKPELWQYYLVAVRFFDDEYNLTIDADYLREHFPELANRIIPKETAQ